MKEDAGVTDPALRGPSGDRRQVWKGWMLEWLAKRFPWPASPDFGIAEECGGQRYARDCQAHHL